MFHATNARLARQVRRIRDIGLAHDNTAAATKGWQACEITPGTWCYRDPRFDTRQRAGLDLSNPNCSAASRATSNGGS
jgi:hypothetical protein